MKILTGTLAATMLTLAMSANAAIKSHTDAIIVESPSALPEAAQNATDAMYLYETGAGEVILYLEQRNGKRLVVLDVTDPAQIKSVSQVALDAPAPFDFVQNLGDSEALIRYRDNSGVAALNFRHYKQPALSATPGLTNAAFSEPLGQTGLLVQSTGRVPQPETYTTDYKIVDASRRSGPAVLATVNDVRQRLFLQDTGTLFLLNSGGVTVVRQPQTEQDHAAELVEENHN